MPLVTVEIRYLRRVNGAGKNNELLLALIVRTKTWFGSERSPGEPMRYISREKTPR